jgi:hypothetical protein
MENDEGDLQKTRAVVGAERSVSNRSNEPMKGIFSRTLTLLLLVTAELEVLAALEGHLHLSLVQTDGPPQCALDLPRFLHASSLNVPPQNRQSLRMMRVDKEVARPCALDPIPLPGLVACVGAADNVADVARLGSDVTRDVDDGFGIELEKLVLFRLRRGSGHRTYSCGRGGKSRGRGTNEEEVVAAFSRGVDDEGRLGGGEGDVLRAKREESVSERRAWCR